MRKILAFIAFALGSLLTAHGVYAVTTGGFPANPRFVTVSASAGFQNLAASAAQKLAMDGQNFFFYNSAGNPLGLYRADIGQFKLNSTGVYCWAGTSTTANASPYTCFGSPTTNSFQFGLADAAAPAAQTIGPQSVVAGTTDTAGAAFTIRGSQGTGTGAGGSVLIKTAAASTTGSTVNPLSHTLTYDSTGALLNDGAAVSPVNGTFTITLATGCTTTPSGTAIYQINNHVVTLYIPGIACTSNALTKQFSGIPAAIQTNVTTQLQYLRYGYTTDNGVLVPNSCAIPTNAATLSLSKDCTNTGIATWSNAGSFATIGGTIVYITQ